MHAHIHPSSARFTMRLSQGSVSTLNWALRPMMVSSFRQSLYREPLRLRIGVTPSARDSTHVGRHYPTFFAHTGSCARPKSSHSLGFNFEPRVFAGCCVPLLEVGLSQRYFRESFPRCLHPYPGGPPGALTRFFPGDIGLRQMGIDSATQQQVRTATSVRAGFSGLQ